VEDEVADDDIGVICFCGEGGEIKEVLGDPGRGVGERGGLFDEVEAEEGDVF